MLAVWITAASLILTLSLFIWRAVLLVAQETSVSLASVDRAELALSGLGIQVGRAQRHLLRISRARLRQMFFRRMRGIGGATSGSDSKDIASKA